MKKVEYNSLSNILWLLAYFPAFHECLYLAPVSDW